jgi:hypothetical protein
MSSDLRASMKGACSAWLWLLVVAEVLFAQLCSDALLGESEQGLVQPLAQGAALLQTEGVVLPLEHGADHLQLVVLELGGLVLEHGGVIDDGLDFAILQRGDALGDGG